MYWGGSSRPGASLFLVLILVLLLLILPLILLLVFLLVLLLIAVLIAIFHCYILLNSVLRRPLPQP